MNFPLPVKLRLGELTARVRAEVCDSRLIYSGVSSITELRNQRSTLAFAGK